MPGTFIRRRPYRKRPNILPFSKGTINIYSYSSSGGITFGGAATLARTFVATSSGGITFGSTTTYSRTRVYTTTGGITFGGVATVSRTYGWASSGGLTFGGTATVTRTYGYASTGGITFGGTAGIVRTIVYISSGGITFGGATTYSRTRVYTTTGGIEFGGTATVTRTFAWLSTGGITFGSTTTYSRTWAYLVSGGITFGGEAGVTTILVTPTVSTVEGITRANLYKRFLRETGLGVYGVVTGVAGGATTTFDDTTRLKSSQFNSQDWVGGWSRISKNANSAGNAPETEVKSITAYDPSTNGRVTAGTFSASIEVADEYELWRFPNPLYVNDDLDTVLKEDIFLPCWSVLSEHPDFDMEQSGTDDWAAITGSISKVITAPYITGKRYLAVTATGGSGKARSANSIKVEPNKKYYLSACGFAGGITTTLTLSAYDVSNSAVITSASTTWDRQYPARIVVEFTTPSNCYEIKVEMSHADVTDSNGLAYWDEVILYPVDAYDIALPWWVKNKDQVKAIFGMSLESLGTNTFDSCLKGEMINEYDIRDDSFGKGQLRLVRRSGTVSRPIFIFGVRNEIAYANDTVDAKRVDSNLLIAALARRVFKRLKTFPNSNAMQTTWIIEQQKEWENQFKILNRAQTERVEAVLQTIQPSGYYRDNRFAFGSN